MIFLIYSNEPTACYETAEDVTITMLVTHHINTQYLYEIYTNFPLLNALICTVRCYTHTTQISASHFRHQCDTAHTVCCANNNSCKPTFAHNKIKTQMSVCTFLHVSVKSRRVQGCSRITATHCSVMCGIRMYYNGTHTAQQYEHYGHHKADTLI
jgi:hypothetical protein